MSPIGDIPTQERRQTTRPMTPIRACPTNTEYHVFVGNFVRELCRKWPETDEVSDKVFRKRFPGQAPTSISLGATGNARTTDHVRPVTEMRKQTCPAHVNRVICTCSSLTPIWD